MPMREWRYKALLRVNRALLNAGTLDYFPVPLTEGVLRPIVFAHARPDGGDLRVYSGDYMQRNPDTENTDRLPLEVVSFGSGGTELWTRVPQLRADTDMYLTLFFSAPDRTQPAEGAAYGKHEVWDENGAGSFSMVHHMRGAQATDLDDSTGNNNDVTGDNGTPGYNAAGTIGEAVDLERGSNEYLTIADSATLDLLGNYTIMAWIRPESLNTQAFVQRAAGGWALYGYAAGPVAIGKNGTDEQQSAGSITAGNWWHVAGTHVAGGGVSTIYRNGVADGANARQDANNLANDIWIGGNPTNPGVNEFDGLIGEVRASSTVRAAGWLLAEYRLLNDVASYVTMTDMARTSRHVRQYGSRMLAAGGRG